MFVFTRVLFRFLLRPLTALLREMRLPHLHLLCYPRPLRPLSQQNDQEAFLRTMALGGIAVAVAGVVAYAVYRRGAQTGR